MSNRIVTFMGLGSPQPPHYQPCIYEWEGIESVPTAIHDAVTIQALEDPVSLVVLGTEAVHQRWFAEHKRFEEYLRAALPPHRDVQIGFAMLPNGETETERWQIFETVVHYLQSEVLELTSPYDIEQSVVEPEKPTQIIVDITHGWRSQPFFAASAVAFVMSERQRQGVWADAPPIRILYAAFQHGQARAPVWELTQLLEVMSWNNAIDGLMRYGRSDDLQIRLEALQKRIILQARAENRTITEYPKLQTFGSQAKTLADELATARVPSLITETSASLHNMLDQITPELQQWVPPLRAQIQALRSWSSQLHAPQVISDEGIQASFHLAEIYVQTQRYLELSALLRETLINIWTLQTLQPHEIKQPGEQGFNEQRHDVEKELKKLAHQQNNPGLPAIYRDIADLRNDAQHCAFRTDPLKAKHILRQLPNLLNKIKLLASQDSTLS